MILFFTSGTVSYPKMVLHPQSYGLGHVSTARFWHDLRPGDRHWTVTDTGWAKAAWGGLFGQWHERATVVQVALGKPDADTILSILATQRHHLVLRAADALPPARAGRPRRHDLSALRHCTSAGEPLNPEVIRAWKDGHRRPDGLRRLRPVRDDGAGRQLPLRCRCGPGSMGKPVPGWDVDVLDEATASARPTTPSATSPSASTEPAAGRPVRRLPPRRRRQRRRPSAAAGTSPATRPGATRTATSGSRAATTT